MIERSKILIDTPRSIDPVGSSTGIVDTLYDGNGRAQMMTVEIFHRDLDHALHPKSKFARPRYNNIFTTGITLGCLGSGITKDDANLLLAMGQIEVENLSDELLAVVFDSAIRNHKETRPTFNRNVWRISEVPSATVRGHALRRLCDAFSIGANSSGFKNEDISTFFLGLKETILANNATGISPTLSPLYADGQT